MRNSTLTLTLLGGLATGFHASLAAEEAISPAVQQRIDELDLKVRTLERRLEVDQETKLADKAKQTATVSAGADGFALKSTDGAFQLKLRGFLQADSRWFFESFVPGTDDTYLLRRVRPYIEGTVFNIFDFRIMPDFAGGKTVIQDAYVDARFLPWLQIKGGKFKTPFGIERLQSASAIRFVERALPNNIVPNRDIGGELHGDIGSGLFTYSAAVLNGSNDGRSSDDVGDIDNNVDKDFAGRIYAHPFKDTSIVPLQGLGIGFAASYVNAEGSPSSPNLPSYRTSGQETFFNYRGTTFSDGERLRLSPQGYYYYGPFGLLWEYVNVSQDVARDIGGARRSGQVDNDAWQAAFGYVLTGEDSTYKGVIPKSPFSFQSGTWGAFELMARYSELSIDDEAFDAGDDSFADPTEAAQKAQAFAFGLNWYLNQNVKLVLNYEQTMFDGGGGGTPEAPKDLDDEKVVLGRVQLAF
ncbi:MAG: OprO/OprP family phosphate-selective porin [Chromatiales bacterium]